MNRIIFCNRFAYPDNSATSQLLSDLALSFALKDRSVTLITSRSIYVKASDRLPARAEWQGVAIRRIWSSAFGGGTLIGKTLDYVTFYIVLSYELYFFLQEGDILVAKTDPPLVSVLCAFMARRRRARLVNWLQDLYPEVAVAAGVIPKWSGLPSILRVFRDWSLTSAAANVVICGSMSVHLRSLGARIETIRQIPNWIDEEEVSGVSPNNNRLRSEMGFTGQFVVGYSGNLGRAHDHRTVLGAARLLRAEKAVCFLVIGGGRFNDQLHREVIGEGLEDMFRFLPYQKQQDLYLSLSVPDVHWISLQPEFEGTIFPSKFYGIAAVGRPIIAVASLSGELAKIIDSFGCGLAVAPGDSRSFADAVLLLLRDDKMRKRSGLNARLMVERHFSRKQAHAAWHDLIESLDD